MVTRWLMLGYYRRLRLVCRGKPGARRVLKRCRRCLIWFLTGVGNRARTDICCAFGCREERRREKGNERGRRHYLTLQGRVVKKARNRDRSSVVAQRSKSDGAKITAASPATPSLLSRELIRHISHLVWFASGHKPCCREIECFLQDVISMGMDWVPRSNLSQRSLPERGG